MWVWESGPLGTRLFALVQDLVHIRVLQHRVGIAATEVMVANGTVRRVKFQVMKIAEKLTENQN